MPIKIDMQDFVTFTEMYFYCLDSEWNPLMSPTRF